MIDVRRLVYRGDKMIPASLSTVLCVICVLFVIQVSFGSPRSRDNDGNKYETLLSNPPVEQNLIHGSFCSGDDCYGTKPKADQEDAAIPSASTPVPTASSTAYTSMDGCKRFVERIISSFESSPLMEELHSLGTSDKDSISKKSAATLLSSEPNKLAGSGDGNPLNNDENDNGLVRLPVVRRIFRFYVINNPPEVSVPNDAGKDQDPKLVSQTIVHTEEPKFHSAIVSEPRVILRKIPQPSQSNFHVFPLLTPVSLNTRNEHFTNDVSKKAEAIDSIHHLLHPFNNNINLQNFNYVTSPSVEHVTYAHVQGYPPERAKLPEVMHFTNSPTVSPIPLRPMLYRLVVREPFHVFGDSEHLHRIYPSEATVPVSQWWYPLSSPVYSKQVYSVNPNYGQTSQNGYAKKDVST